MVHGTALPITQVQGSSHVVLAVTGGGGHLGWFDGPMRGGKNKRRWVVKPMGEFLTACARDLSPRAAVEVAPGPGPAWTTSSTAEQNGNGNGAAESWIPAELEGWEHEVVKGMTTATPPNGASSVGQGYAGGSPLSPALSAGVLSEDEEEAEVNAEISRSVTPVALLHGGWEWVQAPPMVIQTGALPTAVGWKVLCRDEDTDKWRQTASPALQGL